MIFRPCALPLGLPSWRIAAGACPDGFFGGTGASPGRPQNAIGENSSTETSTALQPLLGAGAQGQIHPIAWRTLLHSKEFNALDGKLDPDECSQVHTMDKRIPPSSGQLDFGQVEFTAHGLEDL